MCFCIASSCNEKNTEDNIKALIKTGFPGLQPAQETVSNMQVFELQTDNKPDGSSPL